MDCKTISTFRRLEQQAIRQYQISKLKETAYKGILNTQEMPLQVPEQPTKVVEAISDKLGKVLNLFA